MNWRMAQHSTASLNWRTLLLTTGVIISALTMPSHLDVLVRRKQKIMVITHYFLPAKEVRGVAGFVSEFFHKGGKMNILGGRTPSDQKVSPRGVWGMSPGNFGIFSLVDLD